MTKNEYIATIKASWPYPETWMKLESQLDILWEQGFQQKFKKRIENSKIYDKNGKVIGIAG